MVCSTWTSEILFKTCLSLWAEKMHLGQPAVLPSFSQAGKINTFVVRLLHSWWALSIVTLPTSSEWCLLQQATKTLHPLQKEGFSGFERTLLRTGDPVAPAQPLLCSLDGDSSANSKQQVVSLRNLKTKYSPTVTCLAVHFGSGAVLMCTRS